MLEAWLYGSYVHNPTNANDIDILVVYINSVSQAMLELRQSIEAESIKSLDKPTHFLTISATEKSNNSDFYSRATLRGIRFI